MDAITGTICRKCERMSRYIDAEVLKETFNSSINTGHESFDLSAICECIDFEPDTDVEPVRHAHWNGIEYDSYADGYPVYDRWECSKCGNEISTEDPPTYCCDCGAKMDESVK